MSRVERSATPAVAFETCYATHRAAVYRLGLRYGAGNAAWAEDLTHDVFIKLAEKLGELHSLDDVGGWLYRVASNLAISRLRREKSFLGRVSSMISAGGHGTSPGADVVFEERELAGLAMAALQRLPAKERVVLSMKILDDKSQKQIAADLSMSEGYVSKLVARALERIANEGWEVER